MKLHKHLALITFLISGSSYAAEQDNPFYFGVDYSYFNSDNDRTLQLAPLANVDDGDGFGAFLGYDYSELLDFRFSFKDINAESEGLGAYDVDGTILSLDGLYSPFEIPVYFSAGVNRLDFEENDTALSLGLGYRQAISDRLTAFAEAKRYFAFSDSLNSDVTLSLGLSYSFGEAGNSTGQNLDHDNDGVSNSLDQCPNSSPNAKVDGMGCEDSDNDGVSNSMDQCPNSAPGARVNNEGCADSDADGVIDARDQCPNSASGANVDSLGCADDDNDGVNNKTDLCSNTKAGVTVGNTGCEVDKEAVELAILFNNNSNDIKSTYNADIERVAHYMKRHPETKVNIIGHTSSVGDSTYNQSLSERRASSVAQVLIEEYGINSTRINAKGMGESQLKFKENTAKAHKLNRRIEAVFY